ncbi:hypothetical protein H6G89_09085 [Oscillatoria sp. FACHB-1407]|uniref:hypothetical protein n=1 Tax=Oscillatoria sp. FACHB-1407 TaxID=2692847 RepID=UPI001686E3DA|nr:hypothetical protein [Oscillatoria sp. FACHB-1407]MBD2461197.1 hypothetical protein [Oscillatoria sp. FACHB-1407]
MQSQVNLPDASIEQLVEQIFATRRITRVDQERFMSALLSKKALNDAEQVQINRVFDALRSGLIRVVE